jgi:hypothetical protein
MARANKQGFRLLMICVVGMALVLGLGLVILWVPEKMVAWVGANHDPQYATIVDKYRSTLAQSIGGLLVLVGLYFTARNVFAAEQTRLTKTFSDAIAQLGFADKDGVPVIPIRLGGIYALERLSRDSPKDAYVISKILVQYIQIESNKWKQTLQTSVESPSLPDIEASLIVLGIIAGLTPSWRVTDALRFFDTFLPNLSLSGRSLAGFQFHRAELSGSKLDIADCAGAKFQECWLTGCTFAYSNLFGCEFNGVEARGVILSSSFGKKSSFLSCKMQEGDLVDANLEQCRFSDSDLSGSILRRAKMRDSIFSNTNVSGVDFGLADLTNVDFRTAIGLTSEQIASALHKPPPAKLPEYLVVRDS